MRQSGVSLFGKYDTLRPYWIERPKAAIPPYLVGNQLRANPPQKLALSIPEFLAAVPIGRTKLYEELGAGRLRAVKVGKRTLIPITEAERWLATLADPGEAA